jgi:hypothetical protein
MRTVLAIADKGNRARAGGFQRSNVRNAQGAVAIERCTDAFGKLGKPPSGLGSEGLESGIARGRSLSGDGRARATCRRAP